VEVESQSKEVVELLGDEALILASWLLLVQQISKGWFVQCWYSRSCNDFYTQQSLHVYILVSPTLYKPLPLFIIFVIDILLRVPIQHVMLQHEDDIKHNGNIPQSKLDWIASDTTPIILQRRINAQLRERKPATRKIQEHGIYTPSQGRLALVIDPSLRYIFEEDGKEFDIAECVDLHGVSIVLEG
jgi:hypothetical protein